MSSHDTESNRWRARQEALYRWTIAVELIRAIDHRRTLAAAGRLGTTDKLWAHDYRATWDRHCRG